MLGSSTQAGAVTPRVPLLRDTACLFISEHPSSSASTGLNLPFGKLLTGENSGSADELQ
jgi:hypothetical protein